MTWAILWPHPLSLSSYISLCSRPRATDETTTRAHEPSIVLLSAESNVASALRPPEFTPRRLYCMSSPQYYRRVTLSREVFPDARLRACLRPSSSMFHNWCPRHLNVEQLLHHADHADTAKLSTTPYRFVRQPKGRKNGKISRLPEVRCKGDTARGRTGSAR